MAIVYRHRRLDTNEIFYIGIGKLKNRPYSNKNRNQYWKNIVNKTDYQVEIITELDNWEDACELESLLISVYGRKDLANGPLVNMTDGGEGNNNLAEESKNKMKRFGNSFRLGKKHTEETKAKISKNRTGIILSKESKKKQSDSLKLAYEEGRMKGSKGLIAWNKNLKTPEEVKEKQRQAKMGKKTRPHTEETKEKMRLSALNRNKK